MLEAIIDNVNNKNELEKEINNELDDFKKEVCEVTGFSPYLVKVIPVSEGLSVTLISKETIGLTDKVISFFKNISPEYTLELGSVVKDATTTVNNGMFQPDSVNLNYYSENRVTFYLTKTMEGKDGI